MSRRSNSTKQKNKAKLAPSVSNKTQTPSPSNPGTDSNNQAEMLAASLLEALNSVREVDGVFSDYSTVNNEILETASIEPTIAVVREPTDANSFDVLEVTLPCSAAAAISTAVLGRIETVDDFDSDFGANIFGDDESEFPSEDLSARSQKIVFPDRDVSPSVIFDEISLEDCCFDDGPDNEAESMPPSDFCNSVEIDNRECKESVVDVPDSLEIDAKTELEPSAESSRFPDQVSAIDAAVEILSQTVESEIARRGLPIVDDASPEAQLGAEVTHFAEPVDSSSGTLRSDLKELSETLRSEFRQSIEALQASQAAANAAQSEVLKTLTEIMFQSAGSKEIPADSIEKAFSGIEQRLMARIDAIAGGVTSAGSGDAPSSPGPIAARAANAGSMKFQNAASSVSRSWEQIKSEMMTMGELSDSPSSANPQKATTALPEVAQLSSDRHFRLPEQDLSLEIPRSIDPDSASEQELRDAFREREAFITTLIARIRRQQESATGQLSPEQLRSLADELPEELAAQVRHTLKQMDDLARMGELELSLERARIARQVNQLSHSRQLLERNARQMGMIVNADGTISHGPNQSGRGSGSRRWLGKLGFGQQ